SAIWTPQRRTRSCASFSPSTPSSKSSAWCACPATARAPGPCSSSAARTPSRCTKRSGACTACTGTSGSSTCRSCANDMGWPRALSGAALALSITGCASLPALEGRIETSSIADTEGTRLGRAVAPGAAANPGKAGVYPLHAPADAFAARVLLARAAEKSLDVQYYIWHGDQTGYLLFEALWHAAGRGVRVRILLDDVNTAGLD